MCIWYSIYMKLHVVRWRSFWWLHLSLRWHTVVRSSSRTKSCNSKLWGKWKWTIIKSSFSAMHLSGYSWDEGSTLPAAFLWWQEGHVTLRSQNFGSVFEHSRETKQKQQKKRKQISFYEVKIKGWIVKSNSWIQPPTTKHLTELNPFKVVSLWLNSVMTHCGCSL